MSIPVALIQPLVANYFEGHDGDLMMAYLGLAERAGCSLDTVQNLAAGTYSSLTLDFEIADGLLSKMGVPHLWWVAPLREHYYAEDLSDDPRRAPELRCARVGCNEEFEPRANGEPHRRKQFCSEKCRKAVADARQKRIERPNHNRIHSKYECINGHAKTPENTGKRGNCLECQRERNKASYQRHADKRKAEARARYHANKVAA